MKLNDIERTLASVPAHPSPKVELEQYATPAEIAAPLLFEAHSLGDIAGRRVVDLGCGTGVFAIGASLLGASDVEGIEVDEAALVAAREAAGRLGARVTWTLGDVAAWRGHADTVVMNPPFGAQERGADRAFLDAAFRAAPVVYSLHNAATRDFVEARAASAGFGATHRWALRFALRHRFRHQSRERVEIDVIAFRFAKERSSATSVL